MIEPGVADFGVVVQKTQIAAGRDGCGAVAGAEEAEVSRVPENGNAGYRRQHARGFVTGAVVDDDDLGFQRVEPCTGDRPKTAHRHGALAVNGNYHRDDRLLERVALGKAS